MNALLPRTTAVLTLLLLLTASVHAATIESQPFGTTPEGTPVQIYTLRNASGCEARITNYGGIIVSLKVPDRHGKLDDVVLGFDRLEDYLTPEYLKKGPYFGALTGRYANRIARGTFSLDGREYHLPTNDGANTLHGGVRGLDKRVWEAHEQTTPQGPALALRYVSPDGEEGFPGTLTMNVVYSLTDENELRLEIEATTDKDTVLNLTQHTYFNLKGAGQGDILDHEVTLKAARFVPIDAESIPLGGLRPVAGTPMDFNQPMAIGARIHADDEQLKNGQGYDFNYVLDGYVPDATSPHVFARIVEPVTGRVLEVGSTQPGVQFYTGNQLDGTFTGKAGIPYRKHGGFCLEPQHFPDSPNRPQFPAVVLRPGETYHHVITYRFSVVP